MYQKLMHMTIYVYIYFTVREPAHQISHFLMSRALFSVTCKLALRMKPATFDSLYHIIDGQILIQQLSI